MGKKKSDIYVCFQILPFKNKANKSIFQCKFCDRQYLQNATKMESHIITQCQKVPAAIRASYTTKPGNGGGSGPAATLAGLNLSLMNKHDDLDMNDLIREYSDSSTSDQQPEHMVVNVSVPGMYRISKAGGSGGGGRNNHSPLNQGGGGRMNVQPPKNSPPTFSSLYNSSSSSPQNLVNELNQRSMQIRAYPQLVPGMNSNNNNSTGANNRKRAKLDNHANNNNNNNLNNNNYYTIGTGSVHKILIKPSHGVPADKLGGLGANKFNNGLGSTAATISCTGGSDNKRKIKPALLPTGATITKNVNLNNNHIAGFKDKLSKEDIVEVWRLLARAIYSSDVPLSILENEHWINVLHRIQPSLTLPSTSILSNVLLDQEYTRISQEIEEKVEKSHFSVLECVTVPGNLEDEVTLVFYLNCDDSPNPFLYKTHRISTIDSDDGGYTKDILSKVIEDIMLDIGLNKVVAFMSDLTSEMEGTWEILRDKFPGLLTFGCVIHGLNSILDRILTLPEIVKMIDIIKKLYNKIEKSQELKKLVEDILGKKHISPYESEKEAASSIKNANNNNNNNSSKLSGKREANCINGVSLSNNSSSGALLKKWSLVGKLMSQLISEKSVYQQLLSNPDSKKVLDGVNSDSPNGKSDRSLSNHLSSESFWTSLQSLNSITVPCLQWIDALKPDRDSSLSDVPEVFKELKVLLQTHVKNFPVDDTTKQSVHKHFLQVQRKCVNEIHFSASLLNPNHKLRGVLSEDEEAQGVEFLTYFCDSRGYHAGSILRELADYKSLSGVYGNDKVWKMGQTMEASSWWKGVQGESALSNIAISLLRVVPSCSIPEADVVTPDFGNGLDEEKSEKLAFIQYNLQKPNRAKLARVKNVVKQAEVIKKEPPPASPAVAVPAKIEKLRIKIPKKEETSESPAIDLSTRLSGCSQISDDEEDDDDDDDSEEEEESNTASKANNPAKPVSSSSSPHPPPKQEDADDDNSDGEEGSNKDAEDSSSDSDDSSSDDQSD